MCFFVALNSILPPPQAAAHMGKKKGPRGMCVKDADKAALYWLVIQARAHNSCALSTPNNHPNVIFCCDISEANQCPAI